MIRLFRVLALCTLCAISTAQLQGQEPAAPNLVPTGTPPFSSSAGGPDTIDLANLNSHISIPVLHKAGRGTNFTYDLSYDPQGSRQKRPTGVMSKPANGCGPGQGSFIPSSLDPASLFSFSSSVARISRYARGVAGGRAWR